MQHVCIDMLKEGVVWDQVHLKAHAVAIDGLLKLGILQGSKEDILKSRTSVAFFPHGLGHYLGMDTHDTGGHPNYEDKDDIFKYLRVRGALPAGSIITVEPGVCFLYGAPDTVANTHRSISAASSLSHISRIPHTLLISILKSWENTGMSEESGSRIIYW